MTAILLRILAVGALVSAGAVGARAQTTTAASGVSVSGGTSVQSLIAQGYRIVAASSDGTSQFLYLQGGDASKLNKAYACQIQFGAAGGFRGCLVLP